MKTTKAIESLYHTIEKSLGPVEAKNAVADAVFHALSTIQHEGLPVTEEHLSDKIHEFGKEYLSSKNDVA